MARTYIFQNFIGVATSYGNILPRMHTYPAVSTGLLTPKLHLAVCQTDSNLL